jgi:C4-dicarboxylate transporter/malic acid transport protein
MTDQPAPGFRAIVRHLSPAWFAAVMGTAVVPLALSFTGADWLPAAARFFFWLAVAMFAALIVPWCLRFLTDRDEVRRDFNHPVAAAFLPTMPIAMLVLALDLLRFADVLLPAPAARQAALLLWVVGAAGIYVMGLAILYRKFRHADIKLDQAHFGWFIPPVSKLLIPVPGYELAGFFPEHAGLLVGLSTASLGVGFFLFLFVGSTVFQRYVFGGPLPAKLTPSFFVGIAPPAIVAVALFKLVHLCGHHDVFGLDIAVMGPLFRFAMLVNWGLAAWWFLMAVFLVLVPLFRRRIPFAMSWWALTFPTGALAVASGVTGAATGVVFVTSFYHAVAFFLVVIWAAVFLRTLAGVATRRIFLPAH